MTLLTIHRYGSSDAATVVLLHGLAEAGTTWPDLIGHWGDDWDVLAPDLRGHGQSPRFTKDELAAAPEVLLADVMGVLDAQPEPVALIGHSLGGLRALRATIARPDKVWALVLEDPARPGAGRTPDPEFAREEKRASDHTRSRTMVAEAIAGGGARAAQFRNGMVNGVHYLELVEKLGRLEEESAVLRRYRRLVPASRRADSKFAVRLAKLA